MLRLNRRLLVIIHDLFAVILAWQIAWLARFNFEFPYYEWQLSFKLLPLVILLQAVVLFRSRLYRGIWRFASLPDLGNIITAAFLGTVFITIALFIFFRLELIPRSILILYPFFLVFALGAPRLGYRIYKDHGMFLNINSAFDLNVKKALIIGAGKAGEMLARDMIRDGTYQPIGFLDDNPALKGAEIQGIKIHGEVYNVKDVCENNEVDNIVVAIPSSNSKEMRRIVEECEKTGLPISTLPSLSHMLNSKNVLSSLRDVSIEDLLGREKVQLDWQNIKNSISGKTVIVTGGGGSIGSALCEQIIELKPLRLIIVEHSELNLYQIEKKLINETTNTSLICILGNVCDKSQMQTLFEEYVPDIVFHAAAYKHVPILEAQPREALKNNILGTKVIADLSLKYKLEKFVLISTDKAVHPSNILGVSKRIAETYVESIDKNHETKFITVRFGNVLDSAGSVVPLFRQQIKQGGPVTVTHQDITRYFMTIDEAAQLILQAGSMGEGGEIFVLDMGEPVKIQYLAEQMIKLSGLRVNDDVQILHTGLRPGEKMYEELFYSSEQQVKTSHEKIFLAKHTTDFASINKIDMLIEENINNNTQGLKQILFDFMTSLNELNSESQNSKNNIIDFNR